MAIDEAIALSFPKNKIPTLRLYGWKTPTLTLGAFQKSDMPFPPNLKITRVRRITGGRALLHDNDLTYSIVAGIEDPLFFGGLKKTFFSVAAGLLAGLDRLHVHAECDEPKQKSDSSRGQNHFCIQSFSLYEIAVSGKKLIGSAQKRWPTHFLQHGSLRLTQSPFEALLYSDEKAATLSDLLLNLPSRHEIEQAMKIGFETAWKVRLVEGELTDEEAQTADQLVNEKYQAVDWNQKY
jgi:lipoate-protein ligase A